METNNWIVKTRSHQSGGMLVRTLAVNILLLSVCLFAGSYSPAEAADPTVSKDTDGTSTKSNSPYQRLDFQVKASCVTCLRKVAKALKATRGVLNADVSIYYPHWGVVVIDTSLTDERKIIARIAKEKAVIDKLLKQDLKEKPLVVVPRSDAPAKL
jgi:hypothetical protein